MILLAPRLRRLAARTGWLIVIALLPVLALLASPAQAQACAGATASAAASTQALDTATLCLVNRERSSRGLKPLRLNRRLSTAARRHARDMVSRRYFSHTSQSGKSVADRIRRTGYLRSAASWRVGENIAWGSGQRATPQAIVESWMASPGHRANILGSFREVGIGVVPGAPRAGVRHAATYAHVFGSRR